jgi:predicted phosphohydrolase
MKFQLFSDIHLELIRCKKLDNIMTTHIPLIRPQAPILILAGDIGKLSEQKFFEFIKYCSENWQHVLYVMGNHEYYSSHPIDTINRKMRELFAIFPNIHLLDNEYIEIDNYIFYGFVGWTEPIFSHSPIAAQYINDYNLIKGKRGKKITVDEIRELSIEGVTKFKEFITTTESTNVIVITHFPPLREGTSDPKYSGNMLNGYFTWDNMLKQNGIGMRFASKIKCWCSGHTHWSYDFLRNGVRFIANQLGYTDEFVVSNDGVFEISE